MQCISHFLDSSAPRAVGDQPVPHHHAVMTANAGASHSDSPSSAAASSSNPSSHVTRGSGAFFPSAFSSSSTAASATRFILPNSPELDWQDDTVMIDALLYQVDRGDLQTPVWNFVRFCFSWCYFSCLESFVYLLLIVQIFAYLIFYESLKDLVDENQGIVFSPSFFCSLIISDSLVPLVY
jgi:hypothetical protein